MLMDGLSGRRIGTIGLLAVALAAGSGCRQRKAAATPPSGRAATAGTTVDSTIPRDEALRRFRDGVDSVAELTGGAASRDDLIRSFVKALETRDSAAFRSLTMTRQEYAWIYYPTTPQGLPPYDLAPGLLWFMLETRGRIGLQKALEQRGGQKLRMVRSACDGKPSVEGDNVILGPCSITRRQDRGDLITERLFGPIIERHGRFKFVNYANKLD